MLEGTGVASEDAGRLAVYAAALLERNAQLNLTGAKTAEALVPLLLDSLTVGPYIGRTHVDIGSGGGMPAIPAAVVCQTQLTLIEARAKKAAFLAATAAQLGLNARVIAERAEVVAHDTGLREGFETATARAVGDPSTVAELTLPFLRVGGRAILQRGTVPPHERDALEDALLMLGGSILEEHRLSESRLILIIGKSRATPERFPRRPGMPAKRPLGRNGFHGKRTGETE